MGQTGIFCPGCCKGNCCNHQENFPNVLFANVENNCSRSAFQMNGIHDLCGNGLTGWQGGITFLCGGACNQILNGTFTLCCDKETGTFTLQLASSLGSETITLATLSCNPPALQGDFNLCNLNVLITN